MECGLFLRLLVFVCDDGGGGIFRNSVFIYVVEVEFLN